MKKSLLIGMLGLSVLQITASEMHDEEQSKVSKEYSSCCCIAKNVIKSSDKNVDLQSSLVENCKKSATPCKLFTIATVLCCFGLRTPGVVCCAFGCYTDFKNFDEEEGVLKKSKFYSTGSNNINRKQSIDEN